jgi:hypothetical protein
VINTDKYAVAKMLLRLDHESISVPSPNCAAAMGSQQSLDILAQNRAKLLKEFIDTSRRVILL